MRAARDKSIYNGTYNIAIVWFIKYYYTSFSVACFSAGTPGTLFTPELEYRKVATIAIVDPRMKFPDTTKSNK